MKAIRQWLSAALIRLLGFPIYLMSYRLIHKLGKQLGKLAYLLDKTHRKRVMTNLSLATTLNLTEDEKKKIAKGSFQTLVTTALEYFRLKRSKNNLSDLITTENRTPLEELYAKGQGFIIFAGHQANWEVPFLDLTSTFYGVAVGKPTKNPYLYQWILSIRTLLGGAIIPPKKAIATGLKELEKGHFIGLVGDQAFPESSLSLPFFGTRAWTTPGPAILSYKGNAPIIVTTTKRNATGYHIHYSDPIWPNQERSMKEEILRLTRIATAILEKSISETPEQYLWQHNRWKQTGVNHVKRRFRHDFILLILPQDPKKAEEALSHLFALKIIFPRGFISLMLPKEIEEKVKNNSFELFTYTDPAEILIDEWKFQMVIDFTNSTETKKHYKNLGAFEVLKEEELLTLSKDHPEHQTGEPLSATLIHALCKPDFLEPVFNI